MKNDLKNPASWIPKEIFLAYCGGIDSGMLSRFYDKAVSKKNMMSYSFDWFAILLFPAWLGYRKQWGMLGAYTVVFALLPILEALFKFSVPIGAFASGGVILGMQANGLLLSQAHRNYLKLKIENSDSAAIIEKMRDRAKESIGLAIASVIGCITIVYVFSFIADKFIS